MPKTQIVTGLDIGSSFIKILVVSKEPGKEDFDVIFRLEEPSLGVRRGVVIDSEKVSETVRILVDKARIETGQRIDSVFVNIGGSHLSSDSSRGMIAVSRADRSISKEDVDRVLQEAARAVPLPSNNEILETIPKEFIVDGLGGIRAVEGLEGTRLETEILILKSFLPYKNNLIQAVLGAGLQILDIVPSPIASALAVLSQRQKELGVASLDIGAGTSDLAVFQEGELVHLAVIPIGSANITSDIAVGLRTDVDIAEAIKTQRGNCFFKGKDKKEKIEIEGEEPLIFSQKTLAKIIQSRISEIFGEVQKELKKASRENLLPSGVILTGGGAKVPGIVELAKKDLKLSCKLGKNLSFSELEKELNYSLVCGLVCSEEGQESRKDWAKRSFVLGGFLGKIKKIFKNFLP